MKKQINNILFFSCFYLSVFFIKPAKAQFSAGLRAGINGTTEAYTGMWHEQLILPYGGIYLQYKFGDLDLQTGANYSGQGTNLKNLGSGDTYQIRTSYFTVPVLLQYRFHFGGYIEAGTQFAYLLSASESQNNGSSSDIKPTYNGTDLDWGGGIGYEFSHTSKHGFGINARYMRGLSALNKNPSLTGMDVKNRTLSIGLTYRFGN